MTSIHIVIYYQELGNHTHMRVFSGLEGAQRGGAGDLRMTNEEFAVFRERAEGSASRGVIEFVEYRG